MRLLAFAWLVAAVEAFGGPLPIPRGEPQLFVDDSRIASAAGLQRTLHSPRKDDAGTRPILSVPPQFGHEATLEANGNIVFDSKLRRWVMYALMFVPALKADAPDGWRRTGIVRFTSADGLDWKSDAAGGFDPVFPLSREDLRDPAGPAYAANVDACTVWFDDSDREWPYKAWFWLTRLPEGRAGAYYHRSKDGRRFERGELILVSRSRTLKVEGRRLVGPSDTSRFIPDVANRRFLLALKFYVYHEADRDPVTGNSLRSRAFAYVDRIDRPFDASRVDSIQLIPPGKQENGDFPSDEYYDSTAYRYGSHWLGELKIWHERGDHPFSAAGCAYLRFISSLDGLAWRRAEYPNENGIPGVFIPNGQPEGGAGARNDGGYITTFCSPPIRSGDELLFHYGSSSYGKNAGERLRLTGGGIFRARLRLDGFVSVDAGQLTTPPLAPAGDRLLLNSRGTVQVEVLDPSGAVLARAEAKGDDVRREVAFSGRSLRQVMGDRGSIALRLTVAPRSALFAFVVE